YARAHADELAQVETAVIVLETLRDLEHMAVYARDMGGTVRNAPRVCALLEQAGRDCGRQLPLSTVYLGSTDAAAFTQAGVPAAALAAMDPTPARYYHTRLDGPDNLSAECIEQGMRVTLAALARFDQAGLDRGGEHP
ncbi:MAG TPA: M28 family peptidase, partial [Candidatus Hydrogenedentes bacterium]|nr:M28 family peptidase [Candidatus Hydrogenedentota bacterium]